MECDCSVFYSFWELQGLPFDVRVTTKFHEKTFTTFFVSFLFRAGTLL